jgi:hypothetical protein
MESDKNFWTHLLLIKVSQDYEEAEGHAVSFALGEEQAVWVATVAHVLQEVNATSKQSVRNKLLWPWLRDPPVYVQAPQITAALNTLMWPRKFNEASEKLMIYGILLQSHLEIMANSFPEKGYESKIIIRVHCNMGCIGLGSWGQGSHSFLNILYPVMLNYIVLIINSTKGLNIGRY